MKEKLNTFINNLIFYDYVLFGAAIVLFILFIALAILLRHRIGLIVLMFFLSIASILLVPTLGYVKMHEFIFKNDVKILSQKKLEFTQAIVLKGALVNVSKRDFTSCNITADVYKVTGNALKDLLMPFNPFLNMSILENNISKAEEREFKMIIEPFTYSKEYDISIKAKCK